MARGLLLALLAPAAAAQVAPAKWVSAGDLHNGYSAYGAECEECLVRTLQYGWRWPGVNPLADMQVSKGLWIGAQNVADEAGGEPYPVRVVHVGPRVLGIGEVFPTRFELTTRVPPPVVTVDGRPSVSPAPLVADAVDPDQEADVVLTSEANTLLGLTLTRRVLQFSQPHHDDYHVLEYTVTNTGNTDADAEIERPGQTLEGVTLFLLTRLAITRESRYVVANSTGWGRNTMNDARGDGVEADSEGERFRAQFAWHGRSPDSRLDYDNLGASVQERTINIAPGDTLGRLAASAFAGTVTLHADASAADGADDPGQPSTTTWFSSDIALLSNNDATNRIQMGQEYALMTSGHKSPRHARAVEPSGLPGFLDPANDPSLGTPGGHTFANGYGPYTLAPGESVRIVVAEAASGLSREANEAIGAAFKASGNDASAGLTYAGQTKTKNEWVFTSRDSLFQTFRRALANEASGYAAPRAPDPPAAFSVSAGDGSIALAWEPPARRDGLAGFEVYRTPGRVDAPATLVHTTGPEALAYQDTDVLAGVAYYYHVVSVGHAADNDGAALTPPGALRSSRYATQTYDPISLRPVAAEAGPDAPGLRLGTPTPHPVQGRTTIPLDLAVPAEVTVTVHSVTGREVARLVSGEGLPAGRRALDWDASAVAAGVYLVRASAGPSVQTVRVVVVR